MNNDLKIGDRVKLKGDPNSPVMTVVKNVSDEIAFQMGKGVQEKAKKYGDAADILFQCGYFINQEEGSIAQPYKSYTFHKDALEKV